MKKIWRKIAAFGMALVLTAGAAVVIGAEIIYAGDPVYRVYNPNSGNHHYTMSQAEVDMLLAVGWNYEGAAWNSAFADNLPLYRLYNPNADCGSHHYTGSTEERDFLVSVGWEYEGVGWFGMLK